MNRPRLVTRVRYEAMLLIGLRNRLKGDYDLTQYQARMMFRLIRGKWNINVKTIIHNIVNPILVRRMTQHLRLE